MNDLICLNDDILEKSIQNSKKYAVCIWGQLRAVETIINNFNKYLIEPLNADLYLLVQNTGTNIDNNIDIFETNNKIIYEPPKKIIDLYKFFCFLKNSDNYISLSHLQIYYNWYKIFQTYGDIFEKNYEYIILTRSDFLHLFPFPDICNLYNKDKDVFWCYDGHEWGGINSTLICVPSKYIKNYLSSPYIYLQKHENVKRLNSLSLNSERFLKLIFDDNNFKVCKIKHNAFITASNFNEITTWESIKYCNQYKVYYKYEDQKNAAFLELDEYQKNKRWVFSEVDNMIFLDENKSFYENLQNNEYYETNITLAKSVKNDII